MPFSLSVLGVKVSKLSIYKTLLLLLEVPPLELIEPNLNIYKHDYLLNWKLSSSIVEDEEQ